MTDPEAQEIQLLQKEVKAYQDVVSVKTVKKLIHQFKQAKKELANLEKAMKGEESTESLMSAAGESQGGDVDGALADKYLVETLNAAVEQLNNDLTAHMLEHQSDIQDLGTQLDAEEDRQLISQLKKLDILIAEFNKNLEITQAQETAVKEKDSPEKQKKIADVVKAIESLKKLSKAKLQPTKIVYVSSPDSKIDEKKIVKVQTSLTQFGSALKALDDSVKKKKKTTSSTSISTLSPDDKAALAEIDTEIKSLKKMNTRVVKLIQENNTKIEQKVVEINQTIDNPPVDTKGSQDLTVQLQSLKNDISAFQKEVEQVSIPSPKDGTQVTHQTVEVSVLPLLIVACVAAFISIFFKK